MGTYCDQVVSSDALETKMKPNCEQIDAQRSAIIKFYGYYMKSQMKVCFGNTVSFIYCWCLLFGNNEFGVCDKRKQMVAHATQSFYSFEAL